MIKIWTDKKVKLLLELYDQKIDYDEMVKQLLLTKKQIKTRLAKMRMSVNQNVPRNKLRIWSEEDIILLKTLCLKNVTTSEIAHHFPLHSIKKIGAMRFKLGIGMMRPHEISTKRDLKTSHRISGNNTHNLMGWGGAKGVLGNRLTYIRNQSCLDGKITTVPNVIRAANEVLKTNGKAQLGGSGLWV